MGHYYYYWDPTYILVVIGAIICMIASAKVKTTFNKYSQYRSYSGMNGAQVAQRVLEAAGIYDVTVRHVSGNLTDHYDPSTKTVNLSDPVYNSYSVAALGVAAHECGHAIQHAKNYAPLSLRSALVPVANFGSMLAAAVIFQLVTLPVEFDASRRALVMLRTQNILSDDELKNTRKVLKSAAFTYVASAAAAILQLLRIILLVGGRRDDR